MSQITYSYNNDGDIQRIGHSSGLSATYHYKDNQIRDIRIDYKGKQAEYLFGEKGLVQSRNLLGLVTKYEYTDEGNITSVSTGEYGIAEYIYDKNNRIQELHFPDGNWIEYRYIRAKKKDSLEGQAIKKIFHPGSSPITAKKTDGESRALPIQKKLEQRLQDDILASKSLRNGVIIDLFIDGKDNASLNIVDSRGNVQKAIPNVSRELRRLIVITAKTRGKIGVALLRRRMV